MNRLPPLRLPRCLVDPCTALPPADAQGLVVVSLEHHNGRISAIRPAPSPQLAAAPLALTPLVDAHVHLDKAWSAAAFPNPQGTMDGALAANLLEIEARTPEQVAARAERGLEKAWRQGCRALRSHVDSLGPAASGSWEVLQELRRRWAGRVELQLVALAPLLHWASLEGEALARRVAADGGLLGSVVGPPFARRSYNPERLRCLLRLADRLGCGIDLHIDESDRDPARGLRLLVGLLEREPIAVPITCSHASSLALLRQGALERLAERMAALGLSVVALPLTNLWLLGKRQGQVPLQRPQAPVRQLQAAGVMVAMASDNVADPWYPGGDFDPLELLRLAPVLSQIAPWQRLGLAPFCCGAARLLDLPWDGVLREGGPADLVVLGCGSWGELLARTPARRVLRNGRWLPPPVAAEEALGPFLASLAAADPDPSLRSLPVVP